VEQKPRIYTKLIEGYSQETGETKISSITQKPVPQTKFIPVDKAINNFIAGLGLDGALVDVKFSLDPEGNPVALVLYHL
jgi:hypothetical protein